jgi:hypothetical protein
MAFLTGPGVSDCECQCCNNLAAHDLSFNNGTIEALNCEQGIWDKNLLTDSA